MAIYYKIYFLVKKLFRKVGFGENMPFLKPMSTFWPKKGISSKNGLLGAKMPCYEFVMAANDHFLDQ
jgi:hypothetical protein